MKKILEIIVLTVVLMLTYNIKSKAQGWERPIPPVKYTNTNNWPFLDMFPLNDGGCLVTFFTDSVNAFISADSSQGLFLTRFDKYGNKVWDYKPLYHFHSTIDSSVIPPTKDYDTLFNAMVYQAVQLPNNNIVLMHNSLDSSDYAYHDNYYRNKYFTLIDNNGNRIKRVHNDNDSIQIIYNNYTYAPFSTEKMYYDDLNNTIECIALKNITADSILFIKTVYDMNFIKINTITKIVYKHNAGLSYYNEYPGYTVSTPYRSKKGNYYWYDNGESDRLPRILKLNNGGDLVYDTIFPYSLFRSALLPYALPLYVDTSKFSFCIDIDENDRGETSFGINAVTVYDSIMIPSPYVHLVTRNIIYTLDSIGNIIHTHVITSLADTFSRLNGMRTFESFWAGDLIITKYLNTDTVLLIKVNNNMYQKSNSIWETMVLDTKTGTVVSQYVYRPQGYNDYFQYTSTNFIKKISRDNKSLFLNLAYTKPSSPWVAGIVKIGENGYPFSTVLTGNVFNDLNNNCIKNVAEKGLANFTVDAAKVNFNNYGVSDKDGNYFIGLNDIGNYTVTVRSNPAYPLWDELCNSVQNINVSDEVSYDTVNFAMHPSIICSLNTVNVSSSSPFRIDRQTTYYVSYCNNGTITSPNTYITIKLDSLLQFNSATIPYTSLTNNTYRFNIGTLDYLACGSFTFDATPVNGSTIIGQTLCVEAHIYPDTVCTAQSYTGAIITSDAQCLGDSVRFHLKNIGVSNMPQQKRYIVIEDNVLRISHNYQLNAGGSLAETLKADTGKTYRIVAEEPDSFPAELGDPYTTAAVENCQPVHNNFSTGYFTQYPNYDGEPYRAMSCNVITGAYDPNEKIASPVGYGIQHYIEANTQIDYQINFQNTGNDTAFKVVVVDTISPALDINSIQLGVGSHNYQFQRTDNNVVQFVFDSIYLVDSFRNEALSHGFVKFKIQQKANNPDDTKIYNKADIYFDYNLPIVTNQTFHTVGHDFITMNLISEVKNIRFNVKDVKIFPNPFRDKTQIIVESDPLKEPVLLLMNMEGSILKTIPSTATNTFDIYREDLSTGMYIFKIIQAKETIATGKLVVQ